MTSQNTPHGERDALFQDFQPLVRRLLRLYGDDPDFREDLRGELYCRFCELLSGYDEARGIPLRPYLVRMLTAFAHTHTRTYRRRNRRELGFEPGWDTVEPTLGEDPSRQWDAEMLTQEAMERLPEAISGLPQRQKQVVIWRYYEEWSFEEIAEVLGIQPSTARSLLRHGLNALRRRIAGEEKPLRRPEPAPQPHSFA
jgi:RNA polymerase sigma-70 factor, ECF subfamily